MEFINGFTQKLVACMTFALSVMSHIFITSTIPQYREASFRGPLIDFFYLLVIALLMSFPIMYCFANSRLRRSWCSGKSMGFGAR